MGKTAFVLSMTRNMAVTYKKPVAMFSLEMSSIQLVNRIIASESELGSDKIKKGNLVGDDWDKLNSAIQTLDEAPIFIDDTPALSIFELRAKCRRLKMQHDIGIILVDYLQLMTAGSDMRGNREQEVSTISRSLKAIAKELDVPIIALSQLNRSVESREGKRPQLSDLRESGAIEQDADMVIFIHRPEYYGITEDDEGNSLRNVAEIIIAKHRNGAVGDVRLTFRKELARFMDMDHYPTDFEQPAGMTFSSKMNEEPAFNAIPGDFGLPPNNNFAPFNDSGDVPF
jgi:replicative DNA helicase